MEYFCNVLLTTVAFYLFFYIGAMGAGDVKLLAVCAGYFSGEKVLCFLFFALLFAAVFALCKMYLARNLWDLTGAAGGEAFALVFLLQGF